MTFSFLRTRPWPLRLAGALLLGLALGASAPEARAQLQVGDVYPAPLSTTASATDSIVVRLTTAENIVPAAGLGTVRITSATRGPISYSRRLDASADGRTQFTFFPDIPLPYGDEITVLLEQGFATNASGETLAQPYTWTFRVRPVTGEGVFTDASGFNPGPEVVDLGEGPLNLNGLASGDFTGDGYPDLAIASEARRVVTILANSRLRGDGLFQDAPGARTDIPVVATVSNVAAGDLDGDGDVDIVATHSLTDQISLLFNQGDGTFLTTDFTVSESRPTRVKVADVDGDGNSDILTVAFGSDVVALRRGTGGGAFGAEQTFGVGLAPNDLAVVDLDRDGLLDIVVSAAGDRVIQLLTNQGDGTFALTAPPIELGFSPAAIAVGDVFGTQTVDGALEYNDGLLDIVVAGQDEPVLRTYRQRAGDLMRFDDTSTPVDPEQPVAFALVLADVNVTDNGAPASLRDDADLDAITTGLSDGRLVVRRANITTASFDAPEFYDAGFAPRGLVAADFDLDGDVDIATVVDFSGNAVFLYFNEGGIDVASGLVPSAETVDFGTVTLCAGGTASVTLTNTSTLEAQVRAVTFDDDAFSSPATLPFTIPSGGTAELPLTFLPDTVGTFTGSVTIDTDFGVGGQRLTIGLTGEAIGAILTPDSLIVDFGVVIPGETGMAEAVVTNNGNRQAIVDSIRVGSDVFATSVGGPTVLAVGQQLTIPVTFTPTTDGPFDTSLTIYGDAGLVCPPQTVITLQGKGEFPAPDLVATSIEFAESAPVASGQTRGVVLEIANASVAPIDTLFRITLALNGDIVLDSTLAALGADATQRIETDVFFGGSGATELVLTVDVDDDLAETDEDNNTFTLDFNVSGPPDLTPDRLALEDGTSLVKEGDTRLVEARFVNRGGGAATEPFRLLLTGTDDAGTVTVLRDTTLQSFAPGAQVTLSAPLTFTAPSATYTIRATADPDGVIFEGNEGNNARTLTFEVRPLLPDVVAAIEGPASTPAGGSAFYVPTITNLFRAIPGPITARFTQDGLVLIDTVLADGLGVDETIQLERTRLNFPVAGVSVVRLVVDASNSGPEESLENNVAELLVSVSRGNTFTVRPNPFTPNGDGFNDVAEFNLGPLGPAAPRLRIMNFEGRQIFTRQVSGTAIIRWDGRDSSGRDLEPGVYMYVVEDGDGSLLASGALYLAR